MGVTMYQDGSWRSHASDAKGVKHQSYHATEQLAQAEYDRIREGVAPGVARVKQKGALNQDLPVGLFEYNETKLDTFGVKIKRIYIRTCIHKHGKLVKSFLRIFNNGKRTRAEAVDLVLTLRNDFIATLNKEK